LDFLLDVVARVYVSTEFIKLVGGFLGSNKIMEWRATCLFETSAAEREDSGPAGDLFRAQAALKVCVLCYMCYYINSYLTGKLL
jgi:hypothetical protein